MDLDIRSARDFGGPNVVKSFEREYGDDAVEDNTKTFFTFDLCVPACSLKYADNQQICREFARKQGIKVFDVDQGIGSHVLIEEGLALAGTTVVGTDSHLNILGAVDCFGQGMGDVDITFAFKTGKTWFEVPETLQVKINGTISSSATAKDLTLHILKQLGTQKAALKAVEFYGDAVKNLSLAGRITLCSMVTEMAGIIGFIPEAPTHAEYADSVAIDVTGMTPQIASPSSYLSSRAIESIPVLSDLAPMEGLRIWLLPLEFWRAKKSKKGSCSRLSRQQDACTKSCWIRESSKFFFPAVPSSAILDVEVAPRDISG
jgi:3-isopropylmalate/(R)-2-methylmalate dehydratase large subunit